MKGSIYPFKIRIKDPILANTFKMLSQKRAVKIPNKQIAIRIGKKLKPVRRDIFLGFDNRYYRSFLALPPNFDMDFTVNGEVYDFIIKPIF